MKKYTLLQTLLFCLLTFSAFQANAAFVRNVPVILVQPNGDTLRCFTSGDEFYHWLHDAEGYTIVQNHANGWYVYASRENIDGSNWQLVPTALIPARDNPAVAGLQPNIIESRHTVDSLHKRFDIPLQYRQQPDVKKSATKTSNHGTINNIVIFIRFADDSDISTPFSTIDAMFNDSSTNAISMYNYYWEASYHTLRIPTTYLPYPNGNTVISYQDYLPRARFMPYDSTTNPSGYDPNDRAELEFGLLERAINYVNQNYSLPADLNIDYNNDGLVDNIAFVVKGSNNGWNDLLWPHKWSLYDRDVYLAGKKVYNFNLQLEGSGPGYFNASVFCHEMFHSLGAPDLYHYYDYTYVSSVGIWDLMCNNTMPPQHMGIYMKTRYGHWIDSIPEITEAGTYALRSVGEKWNDSAEAGAPRGYRIMAGNPNQWYYLEYRRNTDLFDQGLPGSGLLVYRIDSYYDGCSFFDAQTSFDEVYIFRPGGDNDTTSGSIAQAFFSLESGRTTFTPFTNPYPWLTGNELDSTIHIINIGSAGDSIIFTYEPHRPAIPPFDSNDCKITVTLTDKYGDTWNGAYLDITTMPDETTGETQRIAALSIGDGKTSETHTISVGSQPIRLYWNGGRFPDECGISIWLNDGSLWTSSIDFGTSYIYNPCENTTNNVPDNFVISESANVFSSGRNIVVTNGENRLIEVFDILGRNVAKTMASIQTSITMPRYGVYIVRIAGLTTHKVIVKP